MSDPLSFSAKNALLHAVGLDWQNYQFRNHFVAGPGHVDMPALEELVEAGLMERVARPGFLAGDDELFVATEAGKVMATSIYDASRPKLTRSQERYRRYLDVADCFADFRSFLIYESRKEKSHA